MRRRAGVESHENDSLDLVHDSNWLRDQEMQFREIIDWIQTVSEITPLPPGDLLFSAAHLKPCSQGCSSTS